jgi:hypothetical protein
MGVYTQIRDQGVVNDRDIELSTFRLVNRRPLMKTVRITSIIYMGRDIVSKTTPSPRTTPSKF